jgi:hypothetical protein
MYWSVAMVFLRRFIQDESGFLLASESVLLGTLVVFGLIVGLTEVRNATVQELGDFSHAISFLSQDFEFTSVDSTNAAGAILSAGSQYSDTDDDQSTSTAQANGILVDAVSDPDDE